MWLADVVEECPVARGLETERLLRLFSELDLDAYTAGLQTEPVRTSLHLPETVGSWDA